MAAKDLPMREIKVILDELKKISQDEEKYIAKATAKGKRYR